MRWARYSFGFVDFSGLSGSLPVFDLSSVVFGLLSSPQSMMILVVPDGQFVGVFFRFDHWGPLGWGGPSMALWVGPFALLDLSLSVSVPLSLSCWSRWR